MPASGQLRGGDDAIHGANDLAHVGHGVRRELLHQLGVFVPPVVAKEFCVEPLAKRLVGRLHFHEQSTLEAGAKAVLEPLEVAWRAVARKYDLLSRRMERVEDVEE